MAVFGDRLTQHGVFLCVMALVVFGLLLGAVEVLSRLVPNPWPGVILDATIMLGFAITTVYAPNSLRSGRDADPR